MKSNRSRSRSHAAGRWSTIHLRRKRILFFVALSVAAGIFYLYRVRPTYASTALLDITPAASDGAQGSANPDDPDIRQAIDSRISDQALLERVVRRNHLADDPDFLEPPLRIAFHPAVWIQWAGRVFAAVRRYARTGGHFVFPRPEPAAADPPPSEDELARRLAERISVQAVRDSTLISVTVKDHDARQARLLAKSVIDALFHDVNSDPGANRKKLLAEISRDSDQLQAAEEQLAAYRKKHQTALLETRQDALAKRLQELDRQLTGSENRIQALQPVVSKVRRFLQTNPEKLLSVSQVAHDPKVAKMHQWVTLQETVVAKLARREGSVGSSSVEAANQLNSMREALRTALIRSGRHFLKSYAAAVTAAKALKPVRSQTEKAAEELAQIRVPYEALKRKAETAAIVYQKAMANLKKTDVTQTPMYHRTLGGLNVRLASEPTTPAQPLWPRPGLVLEISLATGLFIGCGSALAGRMFDNTVSTADTVESCLGLPVLAVVPRSRRRRMTARPAVVKHPNSAQADAFRSLRVVLSVMTREDPGQSILFTSAVPGEGKTYCALNTATTLAEQGFRTLLVDGDLCRPRVRRILLDWNENPGITGCLLRPELYPSAVLQTGIHNLYCIGDRRTEPGAAGSFGGEAWAEIFRRFRADFEWIVVDTASLNSARDALCIVREISTVCLVADAGHTPRRAVQRAAKLLDEVARHPQVGVLLNKADRRAAPSH